MPRFPQISDMDRVDFAGLERAYSGAPLQWVKEVENEFLSFDLCFPEKQELIYSYTVECNLNSKQIRQRGTDAGFGSGQFADDQIIKIDDALKNLSALTGKSYDGALCTSQCILMADFPNDVICRENVCMRLFPC